jgi:hypothetical protein
MPKKIEFITELRDYFNGVMERAEHHAINVNEVAFVLLAAVVWKADDFKVLERLGEAKNVAWMEVDGKRYYFTYNHIEGKIDLHANNHQGPLLRQFDNSDNICDVKEFFNSLP